MSPEGIPGPLERSRSGDSLRTLTQGTKRTARGWGGGGGAGLALGRAYQISFLETLWAVRILFFNLVAVYLSEAVRLCSDQIFQQSPTCKFMAELTWRKRLGGLGFSSENPEDLGLVTEAPRKGLRPAQGCTGCLKRGMRSPGLPR